MFLFDLKAQAARLFSINLKEELIMLNPNKIDVVILCGGYGKRLQNVIKDIPKPMAKIKHRPFLSILIDYGNYIFILKS